MKYQFWFSFLGLELQSRDNMTCMLVRFIDGTDYRHFDDELEPGNVAADCCRKKSMCRVETYHDCYFLFFFYYTNLILQSTKSENLRFFKKLKFEQFLSLVHDFIFFPKSNFFSKSKHFVLGNDHEIGLKYQDFARNRGFESSNPSAKCSTCRRFLQNMQQCPCRQALYCTRTKLNSI